MGRITGKVAVITGATGGIGAVAARRFVDEGAKVFLVDLDEKALQRLSAELGPDNSDYFAGDVADEGAVSGFVDGAMRRFGKIDVALLNAGIEGQFGKIADVPVSMFDRVMAVNVRSVWLGLSKLMPAMRKAGGGSIIITSSIAGLRGTPMLAAYATSKAAVIGLMKSAALEGVADKIRVNTVNPAQTRTRMMQSIDNSLNAAGRTSDPTARIPMGRYADPAEIATMMLFLASDESSFCTGATYIVDGGSMIGTR